MRTVPSARPRCSRGYRRWITAAFAGSAIVPSRLTAVSTPTKPHAEWMNGTSRKRPRATNPGHTAYGSGARPSRARAHSSEKRLNAASADASTASWVAVAPSSRRRMRPVNGPVRRAKIAKSTVAEMSTATAARTSRLKPREDRPRRSRKARKPRIGYAWLARAIVARIVMPARSRPAMARRRTSEPTVDALGAVSPDAMGWSLVCRIRGGGKATGVPYFAPRKDQQKRGRVSVRERRSVAPRDSG